MLFFTDSTPEAKTIVLDIFWTTYIEPKREKKKVLKRQTQIAGFRAKHALKSFILALKRYVRVLITDRYIYRYSFLVSYSAAKSKHFKFRLFRNERLSR